MVETLLDLHIISYDFCNAYKPQSNDWHGPSETCNLVCQTMPEAETAQWLNELSEIALLQSNLKIKILLLHITRYPVCMGIVLNLQHAAVYYPWELISSCWFQNHAWFHFVIGIFFLKGNGELLVTNLNWLLFSRLYMLYCLWIYAGPSFRNLYS